MQQISIIFSNWSWLVLDNKNNDYDDCVTDPVETVWSKDILNRTHFALRYAKKRGIIDQGDLVVHMSCAKQNSGFPNTMSLFYVSSEDIIEA